MSEPPRTPPRRPPPAPQFRPEFTLFLVYFFVFFLFFGLLLALPDLVEGLRSLPPAATLEEERAAGARIARRAVQGKLLWAIVAAILALGIGAYARVLPGLKRRPGASS
jgi:hypothetical protein